MKTYALALLASAAYAFGSYGSRSGSNFYSGFGKGYGGGGYGNCGPSGCSHGQQKETRGYGGSRGFGGGFGGFGGGFGGYGGSSDFNKQGLSSFGFGGGFGGRDFGRSSRGFKGGFKGSFGDQGVGYVGARGGPVARADKQVGAAPKKQFQFSTRGFGYRGVGQGDQVSNGIIDDGKRGYYGGASGAVVGSGFTDGRGYDTLNDHGQIGGINASREFSVERYDQGDLYDLGGQPGLSGLKGIQANTPQRPGLKGLPGRKGVNNGLRGLGDVSANQNLGGLRGLGYEHGKKGVNNYRGVSSGLRGTGRSLSNRGDYLEHRGGYNVQSGLNRSYSNPRVRNFGAGRAIPGGKAQGSIHGRYGGSKW